ncbi:chromosome partition protein Smc [Coraliomargarita sp. CAG:312]|nr:chromosome partition protein Smc [Coraliomargarita sp. CAG:312]
MYLKQVTINGFKSFADKTELPLTPGITCIVGPNGCGKSNIVDAIRWVLGEQSAKALRGGKMQDVIFQGTETRKPLQFCDVSLLFTDCEKQLKFNEVEITRKVYRDGGSDYFINGKSARLKDIQNLFMDTGVGRVSYSFMVQGQIDQILSSNPGERRTIFEEAAGITKYKTQRREALNKLALVEQNLARATDRIEEISRQIGTLKRQASKALRYKRLSYRLRHLDLALNSHNYAKQNALLKEDETVQKRLSSEILELSEKLAACEEDLSRMRASRAELLAQLESLRQNASEVRSAKEQAERNSEFAEVRKRDLGERLEQISKELESLKEQLSALEGKAQGDIEVKQMQLNLVSADDEVFRQQSAELAEVEESLRDAENRLSRAKQDSLMNESAVTRLRSNCTTLEVDLKSYQVRHAALSDQIFQLKEENSSLERRCEELSAAMENANERLGNAEADITEAVAKADELRAQYRNQQAEIQQMDRQLASKSAKLSLLNDLQSRMEGFSEGVKAIMKGRLGECLDPLNLKIVSQNVEVADGWTSAFETMLGSAVDAVAIEDSSKLPQALALLRERNLGNACFQIKDANLNAISDADALPQGIWRGCDIVKPQDPDLSEYVRNMVAGCYFCEDIMQFANFALNNKNFKFMAAVAKDGSMLDARGIIYASSGEKRDTQSSFILRNSEIKRIKEEIEVDNDALTTLNERAMQIQSQLESAEAEIENRKNLSSEIKREIASINAQSSSAKAAFSEKNSEIEKKTAAMAEMENSRFEAQDRLNSAMKALEDAEKSISESRNLISETEAQIAELRETKDQKYAVLSETRLELAAKKSRLESLERGLGAIREQQAETRALIERRTIESQSIARQIENFDAETLSERERAKNLAENLEAALGEIEAQRVKVAESETSIAEYENSLSAEREAHMRKTSEKNECQIRIAKIRSKLDFISERILSEYDVEIANVDWKSELWKSDEEFEIKVKLDELEDGEINAKPKRERGDPTQDDLDAMESTDFSPIEDEVRELRERINAMGAVNLVAIEEYAELKERYDFLKTQTDDLWASKNALVADIDEINATSQKLFSETFEQIRKNFAFTFQKIFGGGTADLRLVESEDVLDSGIEIVARPAGTVLKSLSLLSGGQRTMTAVSLLFAIYMVKPSPFCVLDELDAPLDDANIGRYTDMLKEFTRYSQFLVISHNKRTMSAAQTLYGVTMQERGVTRLISMRFNGESTSSGE